MHQVAFLGSQPPIDFPCYQVIHINAYPKAEGDPGPMPKYATAHLFKVMCQGYEIVSCLATDIPCICYSNLQRELCVPNRVIW